MEGVLQDLRFAFRNLRRSPGFVTATVLTISLGIGAATAVMTAVDRIVLRPLPFAESERTVIICETSPRTADFCVASPANIADWSQSIPALESAGVARTESALIQREGRSIGVPGGIASPGFFRALAIGPAAGRLFEDQDLNPGRNHVLIVSHAFWRDELQARPDAIGTAVLLDGAAFSVIGVLPADAYIPSFDSVQVWKPLTASIDNTANRNWRGFMALGRLARGVSLAEFSGALEVARGRLALAYPQTNANWGVRAVRLREHVVGASSTTLWIFLGAVGLLLAVACANVASLLLVRATSRASEFAVRVSLGAGRWRLIRQLLTESAVIASLGGALGLALGALLTKMLVLLAPAGIPRLTEVQLDARTAFAALGLTAISAVLFGLAPAKGSVTGRATVDELNAGRLTSRREARAQSALLVTELALSVALLFGAAVLVRSFVKLTTWDPGFDRSHVSLVWLLVPPTKDVTTRSAVLRLDQAREAAAAIPGVHSVGLASSGPLFGGTETGTLAMPGGTMTADQLPPVNWHDVDPGYFTTLGRRVVMGRDFANTDVDGGPSVAIVNESFAARVFAQSNPLGQVVTVQDHPAAIVGVVSDVRPTRPGQPVPSEIYWPIRQYPRFGAYLILRSDMTGSALERAIKARIEAADSSIRVGAITNLDEKFAASLVSPRFNMVLIATFAVVAVALAIIGVYGLVSYSVSRRTRELGVRIALGATAGTVVRNILREVATLTVVGVLLGLGLALVFTRALSGIAYGVTLADGFVLGLTLPTVLAAATLAGYVPARRASRIDPIRALRAE